MADVIWLCVEENGEPTGLWTNEPTKAAIWAFGRVVEYVPRTALTDAATELVAALENYEDWFQALHSLILTKGDRNLPIITPEMLDEGFGLQQIAQAALAKARGEVVS